MIRTRSTTTSQQSYPLNSDNSDMPDAASKAWTQARKWKAERDALRTQIAESSPGSSDAASKAWTQARKWKAERDALQSQSVATVDATSDEISKAWTRARKWKSDRDVMQAKYKALMKLVWDSRRDIPFWKQNEHPEHMHPIFKHLHDAGHTV